MIVYVCTAGWQCAKVVNPISRLSRWFFLEIGALDGRSFHMLLVVPVRASSLCCLGRASGIFLEEEVGVVGAGISMPEQ